MALRQIITALIIILMNAASLASSAKRNYPVRASVQYNPPYSLFLGDYATPKLIITLTGQDLLDANCPYKLSISLECQNVKVTTKPSYTPTPLYISGGQTIVLTLPKDKSLIPPNQQVMPIVFSWTPKTVGSYQYRFELWECAVPGIPVQTVLSTIRPIYTQTTFSPMLTLHTANLNMKPGMEYAWRVTVEDPQTGRTIDPVACDYAEFVRNMPQTGYHLKVRVKAECYGDQTLMSDYTPYLDTYIEPIPVPEYECGKQFPDREITNLELKHTFAPGERVESKNGDTRYEIIFSEEKNGYLSGQFFMIMDCWGGAKIRCEFSKTQINTDNIVLKTIFHNVPDSTLYVKPETIRKEVEQAFFDAATVLTDFSIKDTVKLDKPYTYLYINPSGKVMAVIDDKGKIKTEETNISATSLKENTLIQGKNGEELVLTKKGQVMGKTEFNATGGNSVLLKEYHRKSDSLAQWQINFSKYDAQTYAFDHIGSGNHGIFATDQYYPTSGNYDFRYKSVECGKSDKVKVEFDTYPQADSVIFKDKYGVTYPVSLKDNVLSFTGVSKADTNYIYAYRGDKKIGKLFLNTYQRKTYKVVLVSVNEAKIPYDNKLEKYLNKVYNQCAVSFKDSTDKISIPDLKTFSHGGSGILTVYNDDQKKVLNAYDSKMQDNTYYLFFVDGVTDKKDGSGTLVSGYMPRGYNCGFIYDGGSERTIAHELGHGIAGLEHVFENSNNSGKTNNLMDYSTGDELWHFQCDQIQDPSRVWMKWNKAEGEGELKRQYFVVLNGHTYPNNSDFPIIKKNNNSFTFKFVDKNNLINEDSIIVKINDELLDINSNTLVLKSDTLQQSKTYRLQIYYNDKMLYSLNLIPYYPILCFSKKKPYDGSFLFDDYYSFNSDNLMMYSHYDSFVTDFDHKKHYVPFVGLERGTSANLSLMFEDQKDYELAKKDSNFVFYISPNLPILTINGLSLKQITNVDLLTPEIGISIKAANYGETSINIEDGDKNIYGKLNYICHEIQYRKLHLVFVNFPDSTKWQSLDPVKFQTYLNSHCMNQLFTKFTVDTIHYTSRRSINNVNYNFHALTFMFLLLLDNNPTFHTQDANNFIEQIPNDEDYHFLPSLSLSTQGRHSIGSHFGYNARFHSTSYSETQEELIAHELGHWLGLHHTFLKPDDVDDYDVNSEYSGFILPLSATKGNFMDYNFHRTYWFKYQMRIVQDYEWEPILELEDWMF